MSSCAYTLIDIMAKKTRPYGNQTVPAQTGGRIAILFETGKWTPDAKLGNLRSSYLRRIGVGESITSQSGKDARFRPVSHTKEAYQIQPLSTLDQYLYGEYQRTLPYSSSDAWKVYIYDLARDVHATRYSNFKVACDSVSTSIASVQWESLASTALQTMLPSFAAGNSFVNYVLELKDFVKVGQRLAGGVLKSWDTIAALLGYRRSDKPGAKLAKAYLSYSFAWGPLYRDLVSFVNTSNAFIKRYDELIRRANKPQQSYWGTTIAGTTTSDSLHSFGSDGPTGGWVGPFQGKYYWKVVLEASKGIRYSATVRYRYPVPEGLRSNVGRLKALLDTLGVSLNPAIIWNAIPFSFVIDWIVNINRFLSALRVDNIDFKTEIVDFCHSVKYERTIRMDMGGNTYHYSSGYSLLGNSTTDYCRKSVYERRVGLPNYLGAMQVSGLNPREFSLLGALVGANAKRLVRRR